MLAVRHAVCKDVSRPHYAQVQLAKDGEEWLEDVITEVEEEVQNNPPPNRRLSRSGSK